MTQTLVTVQQYRDITKDVDTEAPEVEAALDEAVDLLEGDGGLERLLQSEERTETSEVWYVDGVGYVYPLATPVTAIPASATYVIDNGARRLRGVTASGEPLGWPTFTETGDPTMVILFDEAQRPNYATYVYTGGFTDATFPVQLRRAVARLAHALVHTTSQRMATIGAQSLSVGDVSVTYPKFAGPLDELVPGLSLTLRRWQRRRVRF